MGDRILMIPRMGPEVKAIEPNRYMLSGRDAVTWCVALYGVSDGGTRLVSRWRRSGRSPGDPLLDAHQGPRGLHNGAEDA